MAVTVACQRDNGAVRSPPQEVEQGGYGCCGLSGNDNTAWSPPQEVEQGRGRFEVLSGGVDLSIEVGNGRSRRERSPAPVGVRAEL